MYTYTIAARYMFTRRTTKAAIALVAIIVLMYLMVISVLEGFKDHYMDKIQSIDAHMTVDVGNFAGGIVHPEQWADELSKFDPSIKGVTIGIETPAMSIFPKDRTIGTLRGIDLDRELKVGRLGDILQPKEIKEFGVQEFNTRKFNGCLVGGAWRKAFNLKLNDRITFVFTDDDDQAKTVAFNIIGFYVGKNPFLENGAFVDRKVLANQIKVNGKAKTLFVWLKEPNRPDLKDFKEKLRVKMQEIVSREDTKLTSQTIDAIKNSGDAKLVEGVLPVFDVTDKERASKAIDELNAKEAPLAEKAIELLRNKDEQMAGKLIATLNRETRKNKVNVETWQEKDNNFYEAVTRENLMMRGIMGVFLLLTAFILFLIFDGMVSEKIRDIGALRALGASPSGIQKCFLMQAIFIGGLGVLIGMGLAELFLHYMNEIPWIRNNIYPSDAFAVDKIPHVTLNYDRIVIAVSSIASALLGAAIPAWRASAMNPVECLRHE